MTRAALVLAIWIVVVCCVSAGCVSVTVYHLASAPVALCSTDSDCLRLCPPADDKCDGGPQ